MVEIILVSLLSVLDAREQIFQNLNRFVPRNGGIDVFVVGDDWVGKYDYLEELGVTVVYTPYGKGTSSTSLKKKIQDRFEKMKKTTDNHLPEDAVERSLSKSK